MWAGETVTFEIDKNVGKDPFNAPINQQEQVPVNGVLVSIGASSDISSSIRPDGRTIDLTLYIPKTYEGDVGKRALVRGEWYTVIGEPKRYPPEACPTSYNMVVGLEAIHG